MLRGIDHNQREGKTMTKQAETIKDLVDTLQFIIDDENTELCGDTFEIIKAAIHDAGYPLKQEISAQPSRNALRGVRRSDRR